MRRWMVPCQIVALLFAAAQAAGEEPDAKPAAPAKVAAEERAQESRRLLEEVLMARLTKELALDEEQTVLMVRHLVEYRDKMASLRRERLGLVRALRQAVRESKEEKTIEKLVNDLIAQDERTSEARLEILEFKGLELTTWQKARLFLFIHDFESDMRRLLKQAQERRQSNNRRQARPDAPQKSGSDAEANSDEDSATEEDAADSDSAIAAPAR